jgi:hypothetical protein
VEDHREEPWLPVEHSRYYPRCWYCSREAVMNSFYEHHEDSIQWHYRCFDRILLNGLIQPFQQPERVVGFFNTYRQLYPVTRYTLRDIAEQFQRWVNERAAKRTFRSWRRQRAVVTNSSPRISNGPSPMQSWSSSKRENPRAS